MDRRKDMRTDESAASQMSLADSLKDLYLGISLYIFGDQEMASVDPKLLLNRMLSTRSAISTSSSLAEENQRARDDAALKTFAAIGSGQCGTVYALRGTRMVIKLPNSAQKSEQLFSDFQIHSNVKSAFDSLPDQMRYSYNINIPEPKLWVDPKSDHFWFEHASMFPNTIAVPNYGLVSEYIYPLPYPVRAAIVDAVSERGQEA